MTHRQLLVDLWGPDHADATSLLRTHIANLRGKLREMGRTHPSFVRMPESATGSAHRDLTKGGLCEIEML